jgi:hypothetical protein
MNARLTSKNYFIYDCADVSPDRTQWSWIRPKFASDFYYNCGISFHFLVLW